MIIQKEPKKNTRKVHWKTKQRYDKTNLIREHNIRTVQVYQEAMAKLMNMSILEYRLFIYDLGLLHLKQSYYTRKEVRRLESDERFWNHLEINVIHPLNVAYINEYIGETLSEIMVDSMKESYERLVCNEQTCIAKNWIKIYIDQVRKGDYDRFGRVNVKRLQKMYERTMNL